MEFVGVAFAAGTGRVAATMMVSFNEVDCRGGGRRQPRAWRYWLPSV